MRGDRGEKVMRGDRGKKVMRGDRGEPPASNPVRPLINAYNNVANYFYFSTQNCKSSKTPFQGTFLPDIKAKDSKL